MGDNGLLSKIEKNREEIIKGEIAALLHDMGKYHPGFILKQALNGGGNYGHTNLKKIFAPIKVNELYKLFSDKSNKYFEYNFGETKCDILQIIEKHNKGGPKLIEVLKSCDGIDSSDDRGIARRKQLKESTFVSNPFGINKFKIELGNTPKNCPDYSILQDKLADCIINYFNNKKEEIVSLRNEILGILKSKFENTLAETRVPANEVTLWDHSFGTASLYKSVLSSSAVLNEVPESEDIHWRILGICCDGYAFIESSTKIADIQSRKGIIEDLKRKIKKVFEEDYPIGNALYEDINGVYFTFPSIKKDEKESSWEIDLYKECINKVYEMLFENNNDAALELFPFFVLSKPAKTLLSLGKLLKFASKKRNIPKMAPVFFIENDAGNFEENHNLETDGHRSINNTIFSKIFNNVADQNQEVEICPFCKIRMILKDENKEQGKYIKICKVCLERRKGRYETWIKDKKYTIWIDDVADKNSRIALITLNIGLINWLNGKMIGTIYSQTFEDWINKKYKYLNDETKKYFLQDKATPIEDKALNLLEKALNKQLCIHEVLSTFLNLDYKAPRFVDRSLKIIKSILPKNEKDLTYAKHILAALFTKNPSPSRLMRIWRETEEFFEDVLLNLYNLPMWKRMEFNLSLNNITNIPIEEKSPYVLKIKNLNPETLTVFHTENGSFLTIESLDKYEYKKEKETLKGFLAIEEALKEQGFYHLAYEESADKNLLKDNNSFKIEGEIKTSDYHPFIEIVKTPLMLQIIAPAGDAVKILQMIDTLYKERFAKVIGKLPLNASLLVANRKFPLYLLLEASRKALDGDKFEEQIYSEPWWDIEKVRIDDFYRYYPVTKLEGDKHYVLDDLDPISKDKKYYLMPGYFDFELIRSNEDRHSIFYDFGRENEDYDLENKIRRADENYRLFSGRPYYLHQFGEMVDLWELLKNNLTSTQINFIERALVEKIREWRDVEQPDKKAVFRSYAEVVLADAFTECWNKLDDVTRLRLINYAESNFLLDTIYLFRHVLKEKVGKED